MKISKTYIFLSLLLLLDSCTSQICNDYYQDEHGCVSSIGISCRWNDNTNMCVETTGTLLGCLANLNLQACISQTFYPDKRIAQCVFSGYCRDIVYFADYCSNNLSRAGCLSVQNNYCQWKDKCITLSESQVQSMVAVTQITDDLQLSSMKVCQAVTGIKVIHQSGAHESLLSLYLSNLLVKGGNSEYSQLMQIPGCLVPIQEFLEMIDCDAEGLNEESCISITNGYCIFKDGKCQKLYDFSTLNCNEKLSRLACLSITNFFETCFWENDSCQTFIIKPTSICESDEMVSPSVCANISSEECFYDEQTLKCSQKCRALKYQNSGKKSVCKEAPYGCYFNDKIDQCIFKTNQCDKLGQNLKACSNANQYCYFVNGHCKTIENLNLLSCSSGLNQQACVNLTNPSQVCEYTEEICKQTYISTDQQCEYLNSVNQNACKKITTNGCYWTNGNCDIATGTQECSTPGFNKIACLSTTNSLNPCYWNGESGSCEVLKLTVESNCQDLKMVNAVACKNIDSQAPPPSTDKVLCKYNSVLYQCEVFVMADTIKCTTEGLNEAACSKITDPTQSCRWQSNSCKSITSLGSAVTCQSLQSVTSKTCAMIQSSTQKCVYDLVTKSCSTSVPPNLGCDAAGLNPLGCAFQNSECYFDTTLNQCQSTESHYNTITCDTNWPSKTSCVKITTGGQYCRWIPKDSTCIQQQFPVADNCEKYKQVNMSFCLAYEVPISRYITSKHYCTYDPDTNSCKEQSDKFYDCGVQYYINIHACAGKTSVNRFCYFDFSTLRCRELYDNTDPLFTTLNCKYANQMLCYSLLTINQNCLWTASQKKCETITSKIYCSDYTDKSTYFTNSNLCSSADPSDACRFDKDNFICKLVDASESIPGCADNGFNETACLNNAQGACYFDSEKSLCLEVSGTLASTIPCSSKVNKLGCLASLKEICYWDTTNKECKQVTDVFFSTVKCSELNDELYNPMACAYVETPDQYCYYDAVSFHCSSFTDLLIFDCKAGYNVNVCSLNLNCKPWSYNYLYSQYDSYLCEDQGNKDSTCFKKGSESDCLAVNTDTCGWILGKCRQIPITDNLKCDQLTSTQGKFNRLVCQQIIRQQNFCQYDSATSACKVVTTNDNPCNTSGLNLNACVGKTSGYTCKFQSDITKPDAGCTLVSDYTGLGCLITYNEDLCVKVDANLCYFDKTENLCNQTDSVRLYYQFECKNFSDPTKFHVTMSLCKFLGGKDACGFDSIGKICQISTDLISYCQDNKTINRSYCLHYIELQMCEFDWYYNECRVFDSSNLSCENCSSFKQCVNSKVQACQWKNSQCVEATIGTSCTSLTNINSLACMKFEHNDDKCQFKNEELSTKCIVPEYDTELCDGLNKAACLANTFRFCFYNNNRCYNTDFFPFDASCTSDYSFTYQACVRIKQPKQYCEWDNDQCKAITVNEDDTCDKYSSPSYSNLVCASIKTGNCIWNNGCVVGIAGNCSTLGANKGACVNAANGNCVFSEGLCQEATTASGTISISCNDPSNKGGCLNINNGLTCKWDGSKCIDQSVTAGCATYSNVNPGVCAKTTDVACMWNNNSCQVVTTQGYCGDVGLNIKACLSFTQDYCYYNKTLNLCQYAGDYSDLKNLSCDDNLNQSACLSHSSKCCKWDTTTKTCASYSPGSDCLALTSHSKYCCLNVVGDQCTYPICSRLTNPYQYCSQALNLDACLYIQYWPCRWDFNDLSCVYASNNQGCKKGMNVFACQQQQNDHCKFVNNQCLEASLQDSCQDLVFSSLHQTKCILTEKDRCGYDYFSTSKGCKVPPINEYCWQSLNKLGCLDNTNQCQWNKDKNECSTIQTTTAPIICPTGLISRGYCSFSELKCKQDLKNFTCKLLTIDDRCDDKNAVAAKNSSLCTKNADEICQYDSTNQLCTSKIFGTICNTIITQSGCKFIQNSCSWINKSCQPNDPDQVFYKCESMFTKFQCLKNVNTACIWDSDELICKTYYSDKKKCIELAGSTFSPGVCYYFSIDHCAHNGTSCYLEEQEQKGCQYSKSPLGCQANEAKTCYWDIEKATCFSLDDESLASSMTCSLFKYSQQRYCIAPITEGQICHWKDNLCQSANSQTTTCIDDLSLYACQAVAQQGQLCIFDSTCKVADNSKTQCTDNINIYACLAVQKDGQYCKWLGQKCSLLTDDGYSLDTHILINSNSCRKTYTKVGQPDTSLSPIGVKYDEFNNVCQESDEKTDTCDTPGLNYYGCLKTEADTCDWNGTKCVKFVTDQVYTQCEQYLTVSAKVCASITIKGLKCQHNDKTFSCEKFSETNTMFIYDEQTKTYINTIKGMNREACISVIKFPTIWSEGYCQFKTVKTAIDSCSSLQDVNQMSCAAVDREDEICKYYQDGQCTSTFDGQIDTCETKGLNVVGCVQVEIGTCRFLQGSCQFYNMNKNDICSELINSNPNVCQQIKNSACKFSFVNRGCVGLSQQDKCSNLGMNEIGCKSLSTCDWISSTCLCKGKISLYQLQKCSNYDSNHCSNEQCVVEQNTCRNKQCSDLSNDKCYGKIGLIQCYLNQNSCLPASKCSELKNISNCTNYTLNGKKCDKDLYNANHCVDQSCEHLTEFNCTGGCQWESTYCAKKECIYMKKNECYGIMNNKQCYWNGTSCLGLTQCQDYITNSNETDLTKLETLCFSKTIFNQQCKWELVKSYGSTYHCTSSICYSQGQSQTNCHGVEIGADVCVLLPDYSCVACTEITDLCTCMSQNGYCYYNETKGCISYQCSDLDKLSCETNSSRCIYSNNQCKPLCQKLRMENCMQRQESNECHWDQMVGKCVDGPIAVQNINTISDVIIIKVSKDIILWLVAFVFCSI